MSVEVVIRNKQFIKKPLTVQDITMGEYSCGTVDQYMRNTREVKNGDLVIYNKDKIGRGVTVMGWSSAVKNEVTVVANALSTRYDYEMFYDIIRNIMSVWKTKTFEQEGIKYSEADIDKLCQEQRSFTLDFLTDIENTMNDGGGDDLTIFGALLPLELSRSVIKKFGEDKDEEGYADYLHGLQVIDAYYAVPLFYQQKNKKSAFFGSYAITSDTDTIFPTVPKVPPFFTNPQTKKPLECSLYVVMLFSYARKKVVGRLSFEDFIRLADIGNCKEFDSSHVLLKGISEERMEEIAATDHVDPLEGV